MALRIGIACATLAALLNTLHLYLVYGSGRAAQTGFDALLPLVARRSSFLRALIPDWALAHVEMSGGPAVADLFLRSLALGAPFAILLAAALVWLLRRFLGSTSVAAGVTVVILLAQTILEPLQTWFFHSFELGVSLGSASRHSALYAVFASAAIILPAAAAWIVSPRLRGVGGPLGRAAEKVAWAGLVLALLVRVTGWGAPASAPPAAGPNVLVISIDTLRADHLHSYGYSRETSPTLDRLADGGVRFSTVVAPTSWTLPSHMSLLTGLAPLDHGVTSDYSLALSRSIPTLAQTFSAAGYETAGMTVGVYVNANWGFARGFDRFVDYGFKRSLTSPKLVTLFNRWLDDWDRRGRRRPLFLFVHLWDVHPDFEPPDPYDRIFDPDYAGAVTSRNFTRNPAIHKGMDPRDLQHLIALYDGEIRYTDHHIAMLLDKLAAMGELDRTIVSVTADHGEEFFEHQRKSHRATLYDEVLRVPWILSYPGKLPAGRVVDQQVRLIDVGPTLLALAGVDRGRFGDSTDQRFGSRDLSDLAIGRDGATEPPPALSHLSDVFSGSKGPLYSVRTKDAKLIWSPQGAPEWELFDLSDDSLERFNLAGRGDAREQPLRAVVKTWSERRPTEEGSRPAPLRQDQLQQLKDLGYIQ